MRKIGPKMPRGQPAFSEVEQRRKPSGARNGIGLVQNMMSLD